MSQQFIVARLCPQGTPVPSTRPQVHDSQYEAETEANRLATNDIGTEFAVFQRIKTVVKRTDMPTSWLVKSAPGWYMYLRNGPAYRAGTSATYALVTAGSDYPNVTFFHADLSPMSKPTAHDLRWAPIGKPAPFLTPGPQPYWKPEPAPVPQAPQSPWPFTQVGC